MKTGATHGIPSEDNAHPHHVGSVVGVHNGIIENFREIKEELGIEISVIEDFMSLNHAYSHFTITLSAYLCVLKPTKTLQIPTPKASEQIKWVCIQDLENYPFPKANKTLTIALMKQFA